jgi:chromosome segregation ATPase
LKRKQGDYTKEINEIKKTPQDMKDEFKKYIESLRKNNQTEILENKSSFNKIKNTLEIHSHRLTQMEGRISGLKDKIGIKEKIEKYLDKSLKSCARNMQEFCNSIKRPNLRLCPLKKR